MKFIPLAVFILIASFVSTVASSIFSDWCRSMGKRTGYLGVWFVGDIIGSVLILALTFGAVALALPGLK